MVDVAAKTALLRKRVASLSFGDEAAQQEIMAKATEIVAKSSMRLSDAAVVLRKEWLNDMVASTNAGEFRHATTNPGHHFLSWLKERSQKRYHVSYRSVDAVARRLGPEVASKMTIIVWPQEIAWAQRLRLSDNPNIATKAAMFLRESEGAAAKVFGKIADLYGEALVRAGYSDHPAQEITPLEIRFAEAVPEFNPLFLRYAARNYNDVLHSMPREKIDMLAARAAKDERHERQQIASEKAVSATRRFPMRRMISIISACKSMGVGSNELYALETAFLERMHEGFIPIEQGVSSPHAAFVTSIATEEQRRDLFASGKEFDVDPVSILWEVANFDKRWLDTLPDSYKRWSHKWTRLLEDWQSEIVHEKREAPYDPVSDFGFYLFDRAEA